MFVYNVYGAKKTVLYDLDAEIITKCYDISGNLISLADMDLVVNSDSSTGTSTGYSLLSQNKGNQYVLRLAVNFASEAGSYQSFIRDYDNEKYYRFDSSTAVRAYDQSMVLEQTITLPSSAGHNNDGAYYNGKFYLVGGYMGATVAEGNKLYVWDVLKNTVSTISVTGIAQPVNGSTRNIWGVCEACRNSGKLYLACIDVTSSELVHDADDKLSVYEYNIATGSCVLKAEYPWDCVYVQGATCLDGILYVACNTQTTGLASNYKGITIKCIRTDTWELFDTLTVSGDFEPQGMDVVPIDNGYELMVGMGRHGTMRQAVRFTPPYELRASERSNQ